MKKNRLMFGIIGLLVLLAVAACGGTAEEGGEQSSTPGEVNVQEEALPVSDEEESTDPEAQEAVISGQGGSASQGVYEDLAAGFTEEGFPYRGDPTAPVVLEEFSDYLCPFCGRHYNETLPTLVENYIAEGKVQYIVRDMPLVSLHPTAPVGHKAAICAGRIGAVETKGQLARLLEDPVWWVRYRSAEALHELGEQGNWILRGLSVQVTCAGETAHLVLAEKAA